MYLRLNLLNDLDFLAGLNYSLNKVTLECLHYYLLFRQADAWRVIHNNLQVDINDIKDFLWLQTLRFNYINTHYIIYLT